MYIPKIEVYSRFADLLPAKHEYIQNYNRMKQTFGGANVVAMSLEVHRSGGDMFTKRHAQKIRSPHRPGRPDPGRQPLPGGEHRP
jgi:predicted RND superfamily exporter protein